MTNSLIPLLHSDEGDSHNVIVTDTSGATSHANYFKIGGWADGAAGMLILSGWVDGKSPYLGTMHPDFVSFATASGVASGVQGIHFVGSENSEVFIQPPLAVSSFSVWAADSGDRWSVTYGRLREVGNISLNQGGPTGHTV
jgi:hypothetical protein